MKIMFEMMKAMLILVNFFCRDAACSVAGITSDANVLTRELRVIAQK